MPIKDLEKLLEMAWNIEDMHSRSRVLVALVQIMPGLDLCTNYRQIETSLFKLAFRTRRNLFSDINALLPAILQISPKDTNQDILLSVRDVTTWWP